MQRARGKPLRGWDQGSGQGHTTGRGLADSGAKHSTPLQLSRPHARQGGYTVPSAGLRPRLKPRLLPGVGGEGYGGLEASNAGRSSQGLTGGGREGGGEEAGEGREGGLRHGTRSVLHQAQS